MLDTATKGSAGDVVNDQAYEAGFEDMPRRVPDLTTIHTLVGYAPTVQLDEMLHRVIADTRQALLPQGV